jgi:hypothetical protein
MAETIAKQVGKQDSPGLAREQQIAKWNYSQVVDVSGSDYTVLSPFTTDTKFISAIDGNVKIDYKNLDGDTETAIIYVNGYQQFIAKEIIKIYQTGTTATNIYLVR